MAGDMDGKVEVYRLEENGTYEGELYNIPDTDVVELGLRDFSADMHAFDDG